MGEQSVKPTILAAAFFVHIFDAIQGAYSSSSIYTDIARDLFVSGFSVSLYANVEEHAHLVGSAAK